MGLNKHFEQQIREGFANDQAHEINRLYCEARHKSSFAEYVGDRVQAAEDVDYYADVYDEHVKICERLGVEVRVKLDYENWEAV